MGATWWFSPSVALPRNTTSMIDCGSMASLNAWRTRLSSNGFRLAFSRATPVCAVTTSYTRTSGRAWMASSCASSTSYSPSTCLDANAASQAEGSPPRSTNSSVPTAGVCRQWLGTARSTALEPMAYSARVKGPVPTGSLAAELRQMMPML